MTGTLAASPSRVWRVWFFACAAVVLVQLTTLSISPTVSQDEVQTIDVGRLVIDGTSRGTMWLDQSGRVLPFISYVGSLSQELAYRAAGDSFLGPRVLSIVIAIACSAILLSWLVRRGRSHWAALVAALLLLLDPVFERSYRTARADVIAFVFALLACWLLSGIPLGRPRSSRITLFVSGLLTGASLLTWTSAVLLLPLIGVEMWRVCRPLMTNARPSGWFKQFAPAGAGVLVAAAVLMLPILDAAGPAIWGTLMLQRWDSTAVNAAAPAAALWKSVVSVIRYSPFLLGLAVVGGTRRGDRLLFGAAIVVAGVMLATRFYLYRYVYLVPYLAVLAAGALDWMWSALPSRARFVRWAPGLAAIGWAAVLSLGVRTYVALQESPWRSHPALVSALDREVGRGPLKVYASPFEIYYAGRTLGWTMVRSAYEVPAAEMDRLYGQCDAVILWLPNDSAALRAHLTNIGFDEGKTVSVNGPIPAEFSTPRYGGLGYGPFRIYRRAAR